MKALVFFGLIAWVFVLPLVEKAPRSAIAIEEKAEEVEKIVLPFDKKIVHAVVKVESSYNPRAVSSCGAKGLMQLMPGTGREWHRKLGIKEAYNPFDPKQNVWIGINYLKYLFEMYNGDLELALTAYNQGYGRVDELLKRNRAKNLKGIIKDLGPDGRSYAKNVLAIASRMSG